MQPTITKILMLLVALLLVGCASGNYGKVSRSAEVDGIFSSGSVPSGYRYYYLGENTHPKAILGIQKEYTLQTRFWTPVNLDSKQMDKWRIYFKESTGSIEQGSRQRLSFCGYNLLDPQGNTIGMIYSIHPWIVTTFPGEKMVTVYPPEPYIKDPLLTRAQ